MWWTRHSKSLLRGMAGGAAITLGGTTLACFGALCIESTAHRTLFRFFPHWYRDVEYAFGLEPHLLESVKSIKPEKTIVYQEESTEWKQNGEWLQKNGMYSDRGYSSQVCSGAMTA